MRKVLPLLLAILTLCCSCVSKSKYQKLRHELNSVIDEKNALEEELQKVKGVLSEHNMTIEELGEKLSAFEERMELTKGTIITARDCLEDAKFWYDNREYTQMYLNVNNAYKYLFWEVIILEDNGY